MAFAELKNKLTHRPVLAIYDREAKTEVHTDACKNGVAGVLFQWQKTGELKPVQYFSRQTTKAEQMYHSYELETLAVINSLQRFRIYLIGTTFKLVTDCNALRTTLTKRDLIPRIGRWWLSTQEFDFEIEYRPGCKMAHVDALSRNAVENANNFDEVQVLQIRSEEDDWVLAAQMSDERCKRLHEILSRAPVDGEEKSVHNDYVLKENRVYRKTPEGPRWVVPKKCRRPLLGAYHDTVGHFGVDKVLIALKKRYWFPSMRNYVKNYILCCTGCMYNKKPVGKKPGSLYPITKQNIPMDTLHLDHLGPFVRSTRRNAYLVVAIDAFTKFVFMQPVPNTKTSPVIKFLESVRENFGVPRRFICDRGTAFTSAKFTEYCDKLGVKRVLVATATPRANGQVERMNRTILAALAATIKDEKKWDECISRIKWGINTTVSSTTDKSPYEMLLGFQPRGAYDAPLAAEVSQDEVEDVKVLRANVAAKIEERQRAQKRYYDSRHSKPVVYNAGQHVLIRRAKCSNDGNSRKLEPNYKGPYVITKVLDNDRYVVEDMPGAKRSQRAYKGIHSSENLKLYRTVVSSDDTDECVED